MQISREITHPKVAAFLQTAPEEVLLMAMEEVMADEEIATAIAYSHQHDHPRDRMGGRDFLASVGRKKA